MKEKILIMDDEPLVLASMERALKRVGYNVTAVSDKSSFSTALAENPFDLTILDLHIPDITVESLALEARKKNPKMKFIYISGSENTSGEFNFLQKPFRIDELRALVRKLLDESK